MENTTVNTAHDGMQGINQTIQDILALFEKICKESERKTLSQVAKDIGKDSGYLTSVDDAMYGRVVRMLEAAKIPYFSYDVRGVSQKYIFVADKHEKEMQAIVNKARVQFGLQINSKSELDAAIGQTEITPTEKAYHNLTPEMAERVLEKAKKHSITVVKDRNADGTYSVYCAEKDKEAVNRFVYSAAWDVTGQSGKTENKRLAYMVNEKEEIDHALDRVGKNMEEAYIFSASNPECYIHIKPDGYDYIKHGLVTATLKQNQSPEDFKEFLGFQISRLDNAVYMSSTEVDSKGGPTSDTVRDEVKDSLFRKQLTKEEGYTIQAEKELRNWIENTMKIGPDESLDYARKYMTSINMNNFLQDFAKTCKRDTPAREEYYQRVINHLDSAVNHINEASEVLNSIEDKTIIIERDILVTTEVVKDEEKRSRQENTRETEHTEEKGR